jgi:hypothetical protein
MMRAESVRPIGPHQARYARMVASISQIRAARVEVEDNQRRISQRL